MPAFQDVRTPRLARPPDGPPALISKAEAARRLHVHPHTVGDLVARLGIACKPIRGHRLGDGLDERDFARLARRLRPARAAKVSGE